MPGDDSLSDFCILTSRAGRDEGQLRDLRFSS